MPHINAWIEAGEFEGVPDLARPLGRVRPIRGKPVAKPLVEVFIVENLVERPTRCCRRCRAGGDAAAAAITAPPPAATAAPPRQRFASASVTDVRRFEPAWRA